MITLRVADPVLDFGLSFWVYLIQVGPQGTTSAGPLISLYDSNKQLRQDLEITIKSQPG